MLIILDSTNRTLKAEMAMDATTSNCTAVVAYADNNGTTFTEGSTPTSLNGMTAVTILAAPASGVRRIVKSICIYNPDTDTHTTTLIFNDNGTEYPITRLTLAPGASWSSDDQTGVNVGGALTDGDKGDISVSSGGTTWTIDNDAVTYAKLQTVTDARLIGRSAGSNGDAQEITVGTGLSLSAGSLTATASGVSDGDKGDITVSSSGATWTVDNGAITYAKIQNVTDARLLGRSSGTAGTAQEITVGTGLSLSQGATPTLTATGGSMVYPGAGIAVSNGTAWITPKNSPTGDVVGTSDSQALTNKTINGASNTISNINLASQITGTLPVANGGTGLTSTPANGQLDIGNGTGFTRATLTAGSNITITNGAGAITIASTASGGGAPPNHIYGLELRWNPTNGTATNDKRTVRISPGGAYIPALSAVLTVSSSIDVLISTITAKAWYYLYLYDNGGTPAVEASTTVPVFYYGRASHKTGDNSRRFIGAVQADWNATPLLTPFYATCQNDYVIYNHIGFDHRAQWRILNNGQAVTATNFNLRSTTTSNLNAELVPDVVYKSYIVAFVQNSGSLAGVGPRGLTSTSAPNTPFDMAVYAQIPGIVGFPFLTPATVPIDPSDGRTSYYVVGDTTKGLYLDATGCEYWR